MRAPAVLAAAAVLLAGCGAQDGDEVLDVLVAASLTDVVEELAAAYEGEHPGVDVRVTSGGSPALAHQVVEGAPADVFASASARDMATVVDAGLAQEPVVLARNAVQVVVPADDPAGVRSLADLGREGVRVALCQPQVPCGALAREALDAAGVAVRPVTEEPDVRATLTKVRLGEVDAGIVYRTDVLAAGDEVRGVAVPGAPTTDYPVAVLGQGSPDARGFVDLLLSVRGREVLARAGFLPPP
ncbi:molybdate ABC transporter substrate-binding protein [Vallicoccus soli]|uniref:Molybdate ABC transporter substrate-binding protein n=1 Tax=Vallicoccus soli TaxID=2339232 RepID=A0A3A3Z4H9_9ACTN|nr:molybdate ABC transporter substrate-binding protein [Vallicoccus soli]RJK97838.1 molybdate ABC transporter substrate-binding protein [Vallicoccus soli]